MLDALFEWIVAFLPWRVLLALFAIFLVGAALLVVWATHG